MSKNKEAAKEWLEQSDHDLQAAQLLFEADHYTDTISYILQQALEKTLKAVIASQNRPMKKTHNLLEIYDLIQGQGDKLTLDESDLMCLSVATTYYTKQRYPMPFKTLPSSKEIEEILEFAKDLFSKVVKLLEVDLKTLN